jgi:hypothetical protein
MKFQRLFFIADSALTTSRWKALVCGVFVLAVWGAKLWIISRFAGATPVNDEWDAHALNLFVPYMDSTLSIGRLLEPHNEHRILMTRLVALRPRRNRIGCAPSATACCGRALISRSAEPF